MLGGGADAYGDAKAITNGTGDVGNTYTDPRYYIPTGANPTTSPTQPSTSTDGGATNPQYGYLYNFCAANGGQAGNGACSGSSSTVVTTTISVCPSNWRLPTGNGGEFGALSAAVNATNDAAGSTNLRTAWFGQYGGGMSGGLGGQGGGGRYWSSTQNSNTNAYSFDFSSTSVNSSSYIYKDNGRTVRCIAQS